ncbi:MAG: glycoside hydrolase family 3 protein [Treponema sp.]|uniref:glycoside hydrolase family 3 N-terminal domain-containing protein n=1 Tax=Treponema sp. TaxID=166 RepID=UPI00298E6932|nr:glycoside hydrolase family 3 N-terminal domain-containing protein [Treponema sp.]MBR5934218.1 glycoside hydrolase family 3 protein [Treponema sp.]
MTQKNMTKALICSLILILFPIFNGTSQDNKGEVQPELTASEDDSDKVIKAFIEKLSLEEKISQLFLINLENDDKFLSVEYYEKDGERKTLIPGGYIFFSYNIADNIEQIMGFTDSIIKHAENQGSIIPYLCVDAEGGYVNRLRTVAGPLAENERVSACLTPEQSYELYSYYAKQMNSLGFNLNLAPVSEICSEKNKDFLNGRSYGVKDKVIDYSVNCVNAYQHNKVAAILKHFPGNTNVDPHIGLPKIDMSQDEFLEITQTFSEIIDRSKPAGILMSHAVVPDFDSHPSCLSEYWVTEILRETLNYDGLIFSDDIFMGALLQNGYSPEKACRLAVESGINCIMISQKTFKKWMNIFVKICNDDAEFTKKIEESLYRIIKFKLEYGVMTSESLSSQKKNIYINQISEKIPFAERERLLNDDHGLRAYIFNLNKNNTKRMYYDYFYKTADDDEKRFLNVRKSADDGTADEAE